MKRTARTFLAGISLFAAAALVERPAHAGNSTANLSVSASISANCLISTSALSFGAYDPLVANKSSDLAASGGVTVTCTNGASATIMLGQGQHATLASTDAAPARQLADSNGDKLTYSLYQDAQLASVWGNTSGTGVAHTGTGSSAAFTIYGIVDKNQNLPAGSYSDTVVANVTF
jgi:spore coat protein U-like protein